MSKLNTAMNVIGTVSALKSLFGYGGGAGGKINNFISEIRNSSVARTNLFEVTITAPNILGGSATAPKISLYAEGAQLPGLFIQTADLKRFGYGPNEKVPYSLQTNDTTINFIGDGKGEIYKFFYRWLQGIVRADQAVPSGSTVNGLAPYEVEFKDQYRSKITITTFNEQGTPVLTYDLSDAYPINIPDIALNWSDTGIMQFSVQFAFLQSKLVNVDQPLELTKNGFSGLSGLQQLVKVGTAVQTIASLRRPRGVQDAISSVSTIKNIFN